MTRGQYARAVDPDTAQALVSPEGARALDAAAAFDDPDSLAAGERMRREFPPLLAAAALTQIGLRRRARAKLGECASAMLWTPDGVEQATRAQVSAWRAARLAASGIEQVIDIGCGCGADALAFLDAGMTVRAVEMDPATAMLARFNLDVASSGSGRAEVLCGDGVELVDKLVADAKEPACVFLDPARRTSHGRSWRVADLSPAWSFVEEQLASDHPSVVKLGPGFPRELIPEDTEAIWVSDGGELVECGLWHLPDAPDWLPGRSAMLLPQGIRAAGDDGADHLGVAPVGRYLYEPDPAVSRAQAITAISGKTPGLNGHDSGLWRLAPEVGYLSGNELFNTDLAQAFEVIDVLDAGLKSLRKWVRQERIGTLEIKKRAVLIDPAMLRRQLRPQGPQSATLVITPTVDGTRALVVKRL